MRLLTRRWRQFGSKDRNRLERRIRHGLPRTLFAAIDAFEKEDVWTSVWDSAVMNRLTRIAATGGILSKKSLALLDEIKRRHPKWAPSPGDRDDFKGWHETRSGPEGHPELLANVADNALVAEAMRLQMDDRFGQGDVWQLLCAADPERALRGLDLERQAQRWEPEAWRCLLWTATDKGDVAFQLKLADLLMAMPDPTLKELLPTVTSWIQRRRETLANNPPDGALFFRLWDRFADLAFRVGDENQREGNLYLRALNEPGGVITWVLLQHIDAGKPKAGDGFRKEHSCRLSRAVEAPGQTGLLARVLLARSLAYVDTVDPTWAAANIIPRLSWNNPEASALWHARARDGTGSPRLFNGLKVAMLQAFEQETLSNHDLEGLMEQLLSVVIARARQEAQDYELLPAEVKKALITGPPLVRRHASWQFWRVMGEQTGAPLDKGARWREIIGPLFREIWPLDAKFRDEGTSHNLVLMALECDGAFEDAVDAIVDFVVPHQQYPLSHSLRLDPEHERLVHRYPKSFLLLASALIDPAIHPVPSDLPELLQACVDADASVVNEPSYIRLHGLRRWSAA